MTQTLETLQAERENLARQIKELDRQIKFVQNNVPKYDINHPDSPIHTLKQVCQHHNCTLSVQQTSKGIIKLELTGNHKDVMNNQLHFLQFKYQTPEPIATNEQMDILCYQFLKLLYSFKAMDEVFFSANRDHKPEIIKLESLDTLDEFKCTIQYGGQKINSTFYLVPAKGNLMRVSAITLDKEVYNNRVTRDRETTYPIDAQGYAFRIHVSQNGETKTTVNHNIRLTKTIYGTTDDPITRNSLCHELKLFVRKYNLVTADPPTVKIIP